MKTVPLPSVWITLHALNDAALTDVQVTSDYAAAGRIKLQAMPFALTLFCTGFVWIWLLLVGALMSRATH